MSYTFSYGDTPFRLRDQARLKRWLDACIRKEKKKRGEIAFRFCSDKEILAVNRQYLQHDYYTDIITFDYSEGNTISADIFVSADTVSSNAQKFNQPFAREMRRVMVHGVLHLCGYTDKDESGQKAMRAREDFYLLLWPQFKDK